ncbi:hypothetical protein MIMGU_mgv1a015703mg [Erythranthe guttata]|uniref:SWIB domain-containing protein n=1 Tax=Erythranthe guttata TaxID=4155 RepID=A0A022RC36_ERYGU|nr:hypothetical protein MIMGU_mgv1a015703mg [Erythranthe guttata]
MAVSLGVFSSFLPIDKVPFVKSSSPYATVRIAPASLRVPRPATISAVAKPATETKPREPRGIMKPRRVSPEMQDFIGGGVTEIPRTQALKEIWAYIKQHNLQLNSQIVFRNYHFIPFLLARMYLSTTAIQQNEEKIPRTKRSLSATRS